MKLAVNNIKNWIYVTGLPRSGTTFVANILSLPLEVDYIHEPFNPHCGISGFDKSYRYLRPTLDTDEMKRLHSLIKNIFTYDFKLKTHVPPGDPPTRKLLKTLIGSRGPFNLGIAKVNPFHKTAIIKDPTAPLLAEYLYKTFQVKPLILVKHPTSFIASVKRLGWNPNISKLNDQPALLEDFFSDDLDALTQIEKDPIISAALFWRVNYKALFSQSAKYSDWQVLTHENLSESPLKSFKEIYDSFGLPWSRRIENKVIKMTGGKNSAEARAGIVQDFNRNSAEIFKLRRDSLSPDERRKIFNIVGDIALKIYSYDSFLID
jgi:hypothetical protein